MQKIDIITDFQLSLQLTAERGVDVVDGGIPETPAISPYPLRTYRKM
jgi:hypothetical protein